jgi:hypothetical protein
VSYIAAGYAVALTTLGAYAALLVHRHRRLEAVVARTAGAPGAPPEDAT